MKKLAIFFIFTVFSFSSVLFGNEFKDHSLENRRVRPGDTLHISVWKEKDLTKTVVVDSEGKVSYLFLGSLDVGGKTLREVRDMFFQGIHETYLKDPKIDVEIDSESLTFFITGEIDDPGTYPYQPYLSLMEAVAIAGGFTDFASHKLRVIRENDSGQEEEFIVDVKKLMRANNERDAYQVQYDDIIVAERGWF